MKECIRCKKKIEEKEDYLINTKGERIHETCFFIAAAG